MERLIPRELDKKGKIAPQFQVTMCVIADLLILDESNHHQFLNNRD
jgi:hypothetical protein